MGNERKTVLITGGASGMGLLLGQCYARDGFAVALVDLNGKVLEEKVAEIRTYADAVKGYAADVRDYPAVADVCRDVYETFGSIDILINCAGGAEARLCNATGSFMENPIEIYDFGVDLNLKGAIHFDHAAMPYMAKKKPGGVIVHLGSIVGEEGCGVNIAYSASKSGLMHGVTKSIAKAGAPYGIRSVCVAPGPVLTRPGMARMETLAGRAAEPQEMVDLIRFVASEKGDFINGTYILADGGRNVM